MRIIVKKEHESQFTWKKYEMMRWPNLDCKNDSFDGVASSPIHPADTKLCYTDEQGFESGVAN